MNDHIWYPSDAGSAARGHDDTENITPYMEISTQHSKEYTNTAQVKTRHEEDKRNNTGSSASGVVNNSSHFYPVRIGKRRQSHHLKIIYVY